MKTFEEIVENIAIGTLWGVQNMGRMKCGFVKLPNCGTCTVIWNDNESGWEHVSIAPKHKYNIPTWDDMCTLKDMFFNDDEEVYQIHPNKSEYVNIMDNCLHLWKPIGIDLKKLVEEKVSGETEQEYNNGWIPCSERLPDTSEWSPSTIGKYFLVSYKPDPVTKQWVAIRSFEKSTNKFCCDGEVIAWQPLPQSYKERKDEQKRDNEVPGESSEK